MVWDLAAKAGLWVRGAATVIALIVVLAGIWAVDAASRYRGDPQLSAYDRDWDDLSDLRRAIEEDGLRTSCVASTPLVLERLDTGMETVLLCIGVERAYTDREADAIVSFVQDGGGTVVVADDFGFGNSIAERFGLRFSGLPVRAYGHDVGGRLVPSNARSTQAYTGGTYSILLNDATFLLADSWTGIDRLAWSPVTSWVDLDSDVEKDPEEPIASVPLAARVRLGFGSAVFISDPSLLVNGMVHERQNLAFALSLLDTIRQMSGRMVMFDESRHAPDAAGEVVQRALYSVTERALTSDLGLLWAAIALAAVVVLGAIMARPPQRMRHRDVLEDPSAVRLDPTYDRFSLYYRLRAIILERTRIRYHLAPWDFYTAYISSLPEDLSEWGLRSYVEERPLDTTGLEVMERAVRSEYGAWPKAVELEVVDVGAGGQGGPARTVEEVPLRSGYGAQDIGDDGLEDVGYGVDDGVGDGAGDGAGYGVSGGVGGAGGGLPRGNWRSDGSVHWRSNGRRGRRRGGGRQGGGGGA